MSSVKEENAAIRDLTKSMRLKLRENSHLDWGHIHDYKLWQMLATETAELHAAICRHDNEAIRAEAADVANYAMMIHDTAAAEEE